MPGKSRGKWQCTEPGCGKKYHIYGSAHSHKTATGHQFERVTRFLPAGKVAGTPKGVVHAKHSTKGAVVVAAKNGHTTNDTFVAYVFGRVQRDVEYLAESAGYSAGLLAERVGELLSRSSRRRVLGAEHSVSGV